MVRSRGEHEALERLLEGEIGGAGQDDTPADLASLADLAAQLRLVAQTPEPASHERVWRRVLAGAGALKAAGAERRVRLSWHSWKVRLASGAAVLALLFGGGVGLVSASSGALPGDTLYPVKRAAEEARLFFALSDDARESLRLDMTHERVRELERLHSGGREAPASLYDAIADGTARLTNKVADTNDPELAQKLLELTERQQQVLQDVAARAPEPAKGALQHALERSQEGHERAVDALAKGNNAEKANSGRK